MRIKSVSQPAVARGAGKPASARHRAVQVATSGVESLRIARRLLIRCVGSRCCLAGDVDHLCAFAPHVENPRRLAAAIRRFEEAIVEARIGKAMAFDRRPQPKQAAFKELEALRVAAKALREAIEGLSEETRWRIESPWPPQ